jgi:hypothetical protein
MRSTHNKENNMPPFREDLMCDVERLDYDFEKCEGTLYVPPQNCTDMETCVELFMAIDPEVRRIRVFSGDALDSRYVRHHTTWISTQLKGEQHVD